MSNLRADAQGRLDFTGRMAGALHDPIVPGRRTRHFRTWGQDEITHVTIAPREPVPAASRARQRRRGDAAGKR